jgi:hypothetical protein
MQLPKTSLDCWKVPIRRHSQWFSAALQTVPLEVGSDAEAVHQVARRFSLHPTLQSLVLDIHPLNEAYFCAVFNALQTNTRIEKLTLCHSADLGTPLSATASDAIVRLFQTSICLRLRVIQFVWFTWTGDSLAWLHWLKVYELLPCKLRRFVSSIAAWMMLHVRIWAACLIGLRSHRTV